MQYGQTDIYPLSSIPCHPDMKVASDWSLGFNNKVPRHSQKTPQFQIAHHHISCLHRPLEKTRCHPLYTSIFLSVTQHSVVYLRPSASVSRMSNPLKLFILPESDRVCHSLSFLFLRFSKPISHTVVVDQG